MTTAIRQRMSSESRRDQILDVTRDVVDREGFHAVSIDRIAQECGITRTLIYQQFGTLSGLLMAMVDREFLRASDSFMQAIHRQPFSHKAQFTTALAGVLDAVDAAPATWRMFLTPSEGGPPELYERLGRARAMTRAYIDMTLQASGVETSAIVSPDRELTTHMMYAIAEELVRLRLQDPAAYTIPRLLAQAKWLARALFSSTNPMPSSMP